MAASVVASTVQWIGSLLIQEASTLYKVADQVQALKDDLEVIQQYLRDADSRQVAEGEVRALIHQIRKLAYDAEDVIDTYIIRFPGKAQRRNKRMLSWYTFLRHSPNKLYEYYDLGKQIQPIQSNLNRVSDRLSSYGLRKITVSGKSQGSNTCWKQRPRSYPYDDHNDEYVVGLEKDLPKLLEVLMGEGKRQINVVAIVGMGGSGKTTLARKLYSHPFTAECFDCTAWVFVSQEWRTEYILSEILRKVDGPKETNWMNASSSVEELVDKLRNILKSKSYLIVLDDVWRREALEEILPALPRGSVNNKGSKIIITTRNLEIVQALNLPHGLYIHEPRPLSEEEGWELFSTISLRHWTNSKDNFEILGREMLRKCKGLPLAIAALAGILNTKMTIGEWQHVNEAIRRPRFMEDCQIPAGMLTRMWIAEGLVTAHEDMPPEDVAMQRLEELSHRFMIQVVRTNVKGHIKTVHLHDLQRELCVRKAKELSFLQIYASTSDSSACDASAVVIPPRRAALHSSTSFSMQTKKLRSLVLLTRSSVQCSAYVSKETIDLGIIVSDFKLLRLLNLWGIKTSTRTLPNQLGNLIHLRYLGIRATNITKLPSSIGKLRNLLTLDYRDVDSDGRSIKLPNSLWELALLRHLFLPFEHRWTWNEKKVKLGALKNLRILWGIRCEAKNEWFSKQTSELGKNLEKLKVLVSTEKDVTAAFDCIILYQLYTFHCEWSAAAGVALRSMNVNISGNRGLHKLVLIGLIQVKNVSVLLPSNLVKLVLKDSMLKDEDPMLSIGALPHLKLLKLSNAYMGTRFCCEISSFPALEELFFEDLPNLKMWIVKNKALPCLKTLVIIKCGMLREFPQGLPFVAALQQLEFFGVPTEFSLKVREYGWSRLKLPHDIEAILEECDSPINFSSIRMLYKGLTAGVFLNNKRQKYWVVEQNGHCYNCFMLYCPCLTPCISYPAAYGDSDLDWIYLDHSGDPCPHLYAPGDGAIIEPYLDSRIMSQPEHLYAPADGAIIEPYLDSRIMSQPEPTCGVRGEFDTKYLSTEVTYEIAYVVKLTRKHIRPAVCKFKYDPSVTQRTNWSDWTTRNTYDLSDKPRDEWIRLLAGEFKTSSATTSGKTIRFSLDGFNSMESGIIFQGVSIEPKLDALN